MSDMPSKESRQLAAAKSFWTHLAEHINAAFSIRLWDGTEIPLGDSVIPGRAVSISSPGVVTSLIRRPTLDNLARHFALKHIDFHGADLYTFLADLRTKHSRRSLKGISKWKAIKSLFPFILGTAESTEVDHCYSGDELGLHREQAENKDFIQFHYDLSNEFYSLFLDPEMVYSCAYFTDWSNSLEQAQHDKLDMICRKLMLQPGETFLDIGCGWGALVCHAAKEYGVKAHGVTLSEKQLAFANDKIRSLGLEDRVTVELKDYAHLTGTYDKIASIGMVEHVGIDNMGLYMQTVNKLLPDNGLFLCHGITRPAKATQKQFRKMRPERRLLAKYIFPGGELDHLGHMLQSMEAHKFEVHDVEGWRDHYALTCKLWCQKLSQHEQQAIEMIGEERYRMWLLYLAGVSFALGDGSACIYQTIGRKRASKGVSGMPPTREHLYEPKSSHQSHVERRAA
ncbi:Methoxy mycolic acid synthase MmaA3 [Thalassoglobus neptunius]|uniref:Methoxy mycolic acid synthase MmaA3 n=1 Tax=Thalassoglobus neptunius TaxID=1938619 RepID=A0A5C5WGD7_9PLAN|nr:cyclopropane-fatty-acyl-phospholipid synthase family protein [Thalassoglobus neptunius]TWT49844.1 Methoxy mycolic acid synthase MmaA3 [Thalassoglobus neptunius]